MSEAVLLIGTKKGLWIGRSDAGREHWTLDGPHFEMQGVYSVGVDTRGDRPRLFAGGTSEHWGPAVFHSDDLGRSWDEPPEGSIGFPADAGASLERVWQIQPAPADQPGVVYAGAQPSSLWRSTDGGVTFELVRGLWDHPHRKDWGEGFGGQAIHTVLPHPTDPDRMSVAMSTGGVYQTEDGGRTWRPANHGIKAYFLPDPDPEFGQCVHKLAAHPDAPDRLYAQNHHGVYRSDDGGAIWKSIADGLPSDFGFPIVVHPHEPDTVYVFPLIADGNRIPTDAQCRVFRSRDAGATWEPLTKGLPDVPSYAPVLRDALCVDAGSPAGVYVGTRDGCVYASADAGDTWTEVARHLPDVLTIRAAVLS
ncbi:glycosyl hydrolase BNR repeat-containing glycosyl hydrolase [Kribbella flavida DSM 17836]|uniref:Glycosyl hydrolase BNR repeat-containing glycosyl hydrolase n=1 Tax=Kribbella flavida (strain DSM 17836 / JCM 10339 / NBRC 14399) TaxID=479435 RepID=D2Q0V8_KRIFD|nr:glycosyl hydrolase [Kribbella flavida]ADB33908.1 glycosyl hydrolase BNR repeat-containing glycosyl hydrolase [Kribbella flavida DSM 17836]